jgi:hypothetical protein
VIVLQINVDGVFAFPSKSHSPVAARVDRISASVLSLQGVKAKAWHIHRLRRFGGIKREQNAPNTIRVLDAEPRRIATLGEAP